MEANENVRFVFNLMDEINRVMDGRSSPNDGPDYISVPEVRALINLLIKQRGSRLTKHGQRLTHFILYLNMELKSCYWLKDDPTLNLDRYVHGKPLPGNVYYKIVDVLHLKQFLLETIMCTPYCFSRDLIEIFVKKARAMPGFLQLETCENIIVALMKSIKRSPIKNSLFTPLTHHFTQAMLVLNKDRLPNDILRLHPENDKKELSKYTGYRVKTIFRILVKMIEFNNSTDSFRQYPMYKLKSLHPPSSADSTNPMFDKFFEVIVHKCMDLCQFDISTWLEWYEVEVVEEDTNLQTAIGELGHDLLQFINNGLVTYQPLLDFRPILCNIAIERINYDNADINNIDEMIERVKNTTKHANGWMKKMIDNPKVFINAQAIQTLDECMNRIDYNCFKKIVDKSIAHYKNGGKVSEPLANAIFKGIQHLDMEDKMCILKHVLGNYADCTIYFPPNFEGTLRYIAEHENDESSDKNELLSKLIWLIVQQPKRVFHLLISQYIENKSVLPKKSIDDPKTCLQHVLVDMHLHMNACHIYEEYTTWLDAKKVLTDQEKINLRQWILAVIKLLHLIKPKLFLANVIVPLLNPSPNYEHTLLLIDLTKFFLTECQLMTLPDIDVWDELLIQLAKILDNARWTIETYSLVKTELCDKIIVAIQPLLHYTAYIVKPRNLDIIKKELAPFHLMTRAHFLRLLTTEIITIDGMDEQFIMTIHSQSHISYSNLNKSSSQKSQEEFVFSIATYMPKFTLHEMKSFVANYLNSAKDPDILDASLFIVESAINAFMRIIVYLKTAIVNEPYNIELAWNYLENTIINFLDVLNTSKMRCIYEENADANLIFNIITKLIMLTKQFGNSRQLPLLVVIRRLTDQILPQLNNECISKLLALIASMKTINSRATMGNTARLLMSKLSSTIPS